MNDKMLFKHHYFTLFKKGNRVYKWVHVYDWSTFVHKQVRREGQIIKKRSNSITILWKNTSRLDKCFIEEVVNTISLQYEPNDILKEIL